MKTTKLILALALAATTATAFAQTGGKADDDSTAAKVEKFFAPNAETLRYEQQNEAQKAKLESEGFPQYTN